MTLYKFRSLENFEFVADIILNNRLYAAKFDTFNDPMEGLYFHRKEDEKYNSMLQDEIKELNICSLSKTFKSPLLWAHYANDFKGICIKLEIDEKDNEVKEINYTREKPTFLSIKIPEFDALKYELDAKSALSHKFVEWKSEKEVRFFTKEEYLFKGVIIKSIYFGIRTSKRHKQLIAKLVEGKSISLFETDINVKNQVIRKQKVNPIQN